MRKVFFVFGALLVTVAFYGSAVATDGGNIFAAKCSMCHGKDAKGSAMAPQLAGSEFIKGPDDPIKKTIRDGRAGNDKKYPNFPLAMPKLGLHEDEIDALVKYLKGIK